MSIYFDNAATTASSPEAIQAAMEMMSECYGNPSSSHAMGLDAERAVKSARESLAQILGVKSEELFFTSGGTESANLAILGLARARKRQGQHVISSQVEHPCTENALKALEAEGFEVERLPAAPHGNVDPEAVLSAIREDTTLITLLHVNNETGAVNDIPRIAFLASKRQKRPAIHVDGVQGFCKIPLSLGLIDLYSLSGHKIHGLKGTGALFCRKGTLLKPLLFGGGQQNNVRPGTENTPGIVSLAAAARSEMAVIQETKKTVHAIKETLSSLSQELDNAFLLGGPSASDYILSMGFLGVRGETLIHALSDKGLHASTGSACSSHGKPEKSQAARLGLDPAKRDSVVRFSFSSTNTIEEGRIAKDLIKETVLELRASLLRAYPKINSMA
ncbi:MAG: cysteine desulfurase [Clostridiales bacterium]|jgi:cysteine desulfurase|nr:cysteine desulfurase [Clostridiales bacterium]